MTASRLRLGVYADLRYQRGAEGVTCDTAFVRFIAALGRHVDHLVVFGRLGEVVSPMATLGTDEAEFVPLPDYRSLADVGAVSQAIAPSRRAWRRPLEALDAVLVFGPHPVATALVRDARRRGVAVVLGVRQDLPGYLGLRASGRTRPVVLAAASGLEWGWRRSARRQPVVVTGSDLARNYRNATRLLDVSFSLVEQGDIVARRSGPWAPEARVLSVGRLDPEKNPLLLADITAGLRDAWTGWRVRAVGAGSLENDLTARRHALGVDDRLELGGPVPYGDAIREEYAEADVLVHVSHTEGQPQVLLEAMAAGLPIVGTAVGGVPSLLGDGERGLLVGPDDADAIVAGLERLRHEPELRNRLVAAGRDFVRTRTTDAEAGRVVDFIEAVR